MPRTRSHKTFPITRAVFWPMKRSLSRSPNTEQLKGMNQERFSSQIVANCHSDVRTRMRSEAINLTIRYWIRQVSDCCFCYPTSDQNLKSVWVIIKQSGIGTDIKPVAFTPTHIAYRKRSRSRRLKVETFRCSRLMSWRTIREVLKLRRRGARRLTINSRSVISRQSKANWRADEIVNSKPTKRGVLCILSL